MDSNTLQQMIDAAQVTLNNAKLIADAAQKINDAAAVVDTASQTAYNNQMNKLSDLRLQSVQARADGNLDLATQIDAQLGTETLTFNQLTNTMQANHNAAQIAASGVAEAQTNLQTDQTNLQTLQAEQKVTNTTTSQSSSSATPSVPVQTTATPLPAKTTIVEDPVIPATTTLSMTSTPATVPYVTGKDAESWAAGITTSPATTGNATISDTVLFTTKIVPGSNMDVVDALDYTTISGTGFRALNAQEIASIGNPKGLTIDESAITGVTYKTAWQNANKKLEMQNEDVDNIINANAFPAKASNADGLTPARYDYTIQVGDTRYPMMVSLEDKLQEARASLGIPVHGQNDIARAMKYYMYNRFKTPDTNLAHNKSFTYVFFTRPDLNLLNYTGGANSQVKNHSEAAMLWRRNPDLFKLLTDYKRCQDSNNFNMLLSSQVTSFDIQDEQLTTTEAGKSWANYEMIYGDEYSGRAAGEFNCNFMETSDYSIINLLKLWITYIYNVRRGSWAPSYNLFGANGGVANPIVANTSHVYTKTLDYGASAYVFKCGPDGEDVLYWSKYYGVIPTNTGASALSWELSKSVGDNPNLNIHFKYSFKRDMSPISLLEFNSVANIGTAAEATYENSYNVNYAHSSRPYVGPPFIEMRFEDPKSFRADGGSNTGPNAPTSSIRLKFRSSADAKLTDQIVYRSTMANRII